jgi:hypothetical protein
VNKENTAKIFADFPDMYGEKMRFYGLHGIFCRDGWFPLIYKLTQDLEIEAKRLNVSVKVSQIKEKFGTLRFHVDTEFKDILATLDLEQNFPSIRKLINDAQNESKTVCEYCGAAGTLKENGNWRVTCEPCELKIQHIG